MPFALTVIVYVPLSVIKVDKSTNQPLAGAKLVVKDSAGNTITGWTSTTNGHVIRNLKPGTYTVTETSAPKGYKLNTTPIEFKVDADGNLYIKNSNNEYISANGIILYNEPVEVIIPDVPKTGLSSTLTYVVGSLILVGGVIILIKNGKKC